MLRPKQQRFTEEYLIDLSQKQAAIRAGYNPNSADVTAARLMKKPEIMAAIDKGIVERSERTQITADNVLRELSLLGFANMSDYVKTDTDGNVLVDLSKADRDQFAAIGEVIVDVYMDGKGKDAREVKRTKFKLLDKKGALTDLARHLGLFNDKLSLGADQSLLDILKEIDGKSRGLPNKANGQSLQPPLATQ